MSEGTVKTQTLSELEHLRQEALRSTIGGNAKKEVHVTKNKYHFHGGWKKSREWFEDLCDGVCSPLGLKPGSFCKGNGGCCCCRRFICSFQCQIHNTNQTNWGFEDLPIKLSEHHATPAGP